MKSIPDDATGEALRQLMERGSDLSKPMEMDFFITVPSKEAGDKVAIKVRELGFTTAVEQEDELDEEGHPPDHQMEWTCYCTKTLIPDYSEIVQIEEQLESIAKEFGGYTDGFGSFGNAEEDEEDEEDD
jgi:regulator of RNase E activity RraB